MATCVSFYFFSFLFLIFFFFFFFFSPCRVSDLTYGTIALATRGRPNPGTLKLHSSGLLAWRSQRSARVVSLPPAEVVRCEWLRVHPASNGHRCRVGTRAGALVRWVLLLGLADARRLLGSWACGIAVAAAAAVVVAVAAVVFIITITSFGFFFGVAWAQRRRLTIL
jgi:hypothetical protein